MNYTAFLSYAVLASITPGPNNIISMSNTSKYGLKGGFRFNIGVFFGALAIISVCTFLSSVLYSFIPKIEPLMLCIGAAYILWLAWSVWRDSAHDEKKRIIETNSVLSGVILQFINVKLFLYAITCMSTFVLPHYKGSAALIPFILLMTVIGFIATCCWSLFGAALDVFFNKHKKVMNAVMALLLVYCAASLLTGLL